jgi:YHS domain-containing protein
MVLDPICLMEIDEKSAPAKSVYNGQTFYFCHENCKRRFEEDPEKYIDVEEKERQGRKAVASFYRDKPVRSRSG